MSPFQKTLMSQFTPYTSDAPALTRQSPQGSTQNTMAGVTALWPLERKPPIPSTRQEARHCISSSRGEWTCMSPHEMRPDSPLETPEEPRDTCQHWSGILSLWPQLQMKTSAPAANAEESQEGPSNSHGDWTFPRPHERVCEVLVVPREEPEISNHKSKKKTRRFSPQCEMRPFSAETSGEKSHYHSLPSKRSLTTRGNSRSSPTYPSPLERNTEVPAITQEASQVSLLISW